MIPQHSIAEKPTAEKQRIDFISKQFEKHAKNVILSKKNLNHEGTKTRRKKEKKKKRKKEKKKKRKREKEKKEKDLKKTDHVLLSVNRSTFFISTLIIILK